MAASPPPIAQGRAIAQSRAAPFRMAFLPEHRTCGAQLATMRARGVSEREIARKLGLRPGQPMPFDPTAPADAAKASGAEVGAPQPDRRRAGHPLREPATAWERAYVIPGSPPRVPMWVFTQSVAQVCGIKASALKGSSRAARTAGPRALLCFLLVTHTMLSKSAVGARIGRHHTTVLHACRRVEGRLAEGDAATVERYARVLRRLIRFDQGLDQGLDQQAAER